MTILAIDLGGQSAKIGLVKNKKIIKRWIIKTNLDKLFQNIYDNLIDIDWSIVDSIGLSMPGIIEPKTGKVRLSANLNLKNFDTKREFKKCFGKDVYVINDVNAAALGEFWVGAGAKYHSMLFYTIGTGIGGGLVLDGNLITGAHGFAGEFGHGGNFQKERDCSCGTKHCLEPISSAIGIEKALSKKLGKKTTIKEVASEFKKGNKEIVTIFEHCLTPLANHIAIMETAINPEVIIIGGGPSEIGTPLTKLIAKLVAKEQIDFIAKLTKIIIAKTKNDAGIYGAANWALRKGK